MSNLKQVFVKLDADESIFFLKELEAVKSKAYDVLYPEYKCRRLIPVSFEAGPGAETIKYEQYDSVGVAKIINSYADDLPRADVKGKEFRSPVKSLGASYGYSVQEIRSARMAKKPLEQRKANAAKKAIQIKENKIAFFGDSASGLQGLINHPNIQEYTVPADGTGSSKLWSTKTAAQILRDMVGMVTQVVSVTKGVETPDTLLLTIDHYNVVANTQMPNLNMTILKFFLENNPYIKNVEWLLELKAAGAGATDRMMTYRRDPEKLTLEIPQDFEQFPPQEKGLEFVVACHERIGGIIFPYPLSACFGDGI